MQAVATEQTRSKIDFRSLINKAVELSEFLGTLFFLVTGSMILFAFTGIYNIEIKGQVIGGLGLLFFAIGLRLAFNGMPKKDDLNPRVLCLLANIIIVLAGANMVWQLYKLLG